MAYLGWRNSSPAILSDEIAAQLTCLLAGQRLGVIRLEERQRSLEDIFLELTGKAASL